MRKKTGRSQFVNDKQLYSQSKGHNLKKTFTTLRFCEVFLEALFKICPDEKLKNCSINYPFTWYRKRATPTDLFFCQFFDDALSTNFCSRVIKAQFLLLSSIYDDIEQIYFDKNETG